MAVRKQEFHDKDDQTISAPKRSRITFDVSPELRRRIKMAADQQDLSIGEYLGRILEPIVPSESSMIRRRRPATPKMLEALNRISEEILREHNGQLFEDSTELIRQMREERTRELENF